MADNNIFHNLNFKITPPQPGAILISEPFLEDPNFFRSVILLTEHNEQGSVGLILNKMSIVDLDAVILDFSVKNIPIYHGGPVGEDQLFFIHRLGEAIPNSKKLLDGLYLGGDFEFVKALLESGVAQQDQFRFFVGYSGWGSNQLMEEINANSWIVAKSTADQVFNDSDDYWKEVMLSLGKEFKVLASAPSNPSLN